MNVKENKPAIVFSGAHLVRLRRPADTSAGLPSHAPSMGLDCALPTVPARFTGRYVEARKLHFRAAVHQGQRRWITGTNS